MQTNPPTSLNAKPYPDSATASAPAATSSRAPYLIALIVSLACFVAICIWLSSHRMMWDDEFDAWHLIADPSWRHALASRNLGADGGPPLYYAIGRMIVAITGLHPLALRLYSTLCFWLAAVVWTLILKRHFGGVIAIAASAFAFLCNSEFIDQMVQVRFYGQLMLAFTITVWVAMYIEENRPDARRSFIFSFLAGAFLVTSHPLGVVYSAALSFAQLFGKSSRRIRVSAIAGSVLSWATLLISFRALRSGSAAFTWLGRPTLAGLMHLYNNHPLLFARERYLSVSLNVAGMCLILYVCLWFFRNRSNKLPSGLWLLFCISVVLMLIPVGFFIGSLLYKPMFLSRYMLPYNLGYTTLVAAGVWLVARRFIASSPVASATLAAIPLLVIAWVSITDQRLAPVSSLEPILKLAQSTPVVFQYDTEVLQAHFYTPSRAKNLFYIMLPLKPGESSTLESIAQQGYEPELVFDQPFLEQHREFLYVDSPLQPLFFERDLRGNPHWAVQPAGSVDAAGIMLRVFRYTKID